MKKEDDKCCGECCWFYGEMTDGEGFCAEAKETPWSDVTTCDKKCWLSRGGCDNPCFVSRQEMRHHMAVLLQEHRWMEWFKGRRDGEIKFPDVEDIINARMFAYKYFKTFSKL